jgi:hypothetical protein
VSSVFYYREADIKYLATLNLPAHVRTVEETLKDLLNNTSISFRLIDNNILLEPARMLLAYELKGQVIDDHQKPLEFATVSLKTGCHSTGRTFETG